MELSPDFNIGDTVVCIMPTNELQAHRAYKVTSVYINYDIDKVRGWFVRVEGTGGGWKAGRFISVDDLTALERAIYE